MPRSSKIFWVLFISILCIGINSWFLADNIPVLPILVLLLISAIVLFFRFDLIIYFITFCTPLSIQYYFKEFNIAFSFPSEPFMFGLMFIFFLKLIIEGFPDRKILKHPITLAIAMLIFWSLITTFTSQMIFVSAKSFLARLWFIVVFYFLTLFIFKEISEIKKMVWAYILGFLIVIFYTWYQHAAYDFTQIESYNVMMPFFPDHTVYGAMIAFFIFILAAFSFSSAVSPPFYTRIWSFFVLLIFMTALFLSYSRGAWIGAAASLVFYILLIFRIKFNQFVLGLFIFGAVVFWKRDELYLKMKLSDAPPTKEVSSHLGSITNVSSDVSNLERINRWNSAIGMFETKPLLGYGPGTYSFFYIRFQRLDQITSISSNFGDAGNAHSEYLMPLSESGIFGLITFLILLFTVIYTGMNLFYSAQNSAIKYMALAALLGLVSYFVHGFLNNFLDLDKGAVPFWTFIAIITSLDLKNKEIKKSTERIPLL